MDAAVGSAGRGKKGIMERHLFWTESHISQLSSYFCYYIFSCSVCLFISSSSARDHLFAFVVKCTRKTELKNPFFVVFSISALFALPDFGSPSNVTFNVNTGLLGILL
jgi:hypothetical protein